MKPSFACTRMMGRDKYGEGEKQLMLSVVMAWARMGGSETGSIAFIDDVTAEQDVAEVAGWIWAIVFA